MSQKSAKRLRAVEQRQIELARVQKLQADTIGTLTTAVLKVQRGDESTLKLIHERNEARAENRQAAKAVKVWRTMTYAALIAAIAVVLVAIMAVHGGPEAKAVEPTDPVEPTVVVQAVEEQVEDPDESQLIEDALLDRATRIDGVTVSHYCLCAKCCGKQPSDPGYGITASGRRATPGVSVGVDPAYIPLGSTVIADYGNGELHYYRADDTGSGVSGTKRIDLCVSSHKEALQLGLRQATIWVAEE